MTTATKLLNRFRPIESCELAAADAPAGPPSPYAPLPSYSEAERLRLRRKAAADRAAGIKRRDMAAADTAAVVAARAAVADAEAALAAARAKLANAESMYSSRVSVANSGIASTETILEQTSPPEIDVALRRLRMA